MSRLKPVTRWPLEHWWPPGSSPWGSEGGWQLGLGPLECSILVKRLTHELDQLLQSERSGDVERRSELGLGLASALALEAGFSQHRVLDGGSSFHDN